MTSQSPDNLDRLCSLEARLRWTQFALGSVVLLGLTAALSGLVAQDAERKTEKEIRTERLVVVDDTGAPRVLIGQDRKDTQRKSRAAGITIIDDKGAERGGMGTMEDGSVVLALDAPHGVGNPMPDRIGMRVGAKGVSDFMVIDNAARVVVRLFAEADDGGSGGIQLFKRGADQKTKTKTITFDGEKETVDGGG